MYHAYVVVFDCAETTFVRGADLKAIYLGKKLLFIVLIVQQELKSMIACE